MRIFDLFRRSEVPPEQPPQGSGVMPPSRPSADAVTVDGALGIAAVFRAVAIYATAVTQLSIDVYRANEILEPQAAFVRQPDVTRPRSAFLEDTIVSLAARGNAYWRLHRKDNDPRGEVRTIEVLDPAMCTPTRDGTLAVADLKHPLKAHEFHHLKLVRMPGRLFGMGPIQQARISLQNALDLQRYAAEWFNPADVPPGILTSDQPLTRDQAKDYKGAWYEDPEGIKVLGSGLTFAATLISPEDAQFVETQKFSIQDIARMFGIPAHLLLVELAGSSLTYQNIQQADLTFMRWTMAKPLREIEEAFTFLLPRGQTARFNLDALLRPDTTTRYGAHKLALDAGWTTPNEIRAIESMPPLPGGNELRVVSQGPTPLSDAEQARMAAEVLQKAYLGVGTILTQEEARALVERAGAVLSEAPATPAPAPAAAPTQEGGESA